MTFDIKKVADFAINALTEELDTSIKFGLVCPTHNGSHKDLDYCLMKKSIDSLYDGFLELLVAGANFEGDPSREMLQEARRIGLTAEKAMFDATNGTNTHKGALFCIGLFCMAIGWLHKKDESFLPKECSRVIAKMCNGICNEEFGGQTLQTHGQKVFKKYSATGARGSAERGFDEAVSDFLPTWKRIKTTTTDLDLAKTQILAYVVSKTEDTNILYRADRSTLLLAQDKCRDLYLNFDKQKAKQTEEWFIQHNISSGGSADMLGLTLFLDYLEGFAKK